ncbi:thioredoxin-like domain-containing protein [Alteromonas confluentis]|uniref:Thiol-disulfide isomerase n=1 Tax=Alteromonas confluentis TaxID=1656094 RepID=A0A1E7Z9Z3_9ALTE|nr:thioredoxin-like domain-containing protein [Alteromonas confluentis]OFC70363.1 thiol-disulfide isomerase [Alteromonas confluentis]
MEAIDIIVGVLFVVVLALVVAVWALARQTGILFERVAPLGALVTDSGPAVGQPAPQFDIQSLSGTGAVSVGGQQSHSTLLFFLSPTCPVCKKLIPLLNKIQNDERTWLNVVLASDGKAEEHAKFIESHKLSAFPYLLSTELGLAFRVSRLPFAVLIGENGNVLAKGLVNNREQIESLFNAKEMGVASVQTYIEQAETSAHA